MLEEVPHISHRHAERYIRATNGAFQEGEDVAVAGAQQEAVAHRPMAVPEDQLLAFDPLDASPT